MKIHEFAKEIGRKTPDVLRMLKEIGYTEYTGIMSQLVHDKEELVELIDKHEFNELNEDPKYYVNLVGMYYNPVDKTYQAGRVQIPLSVFEKYGGVFKKKHKTVYNAKPEFNGTLEESKLLYPKK